MASIKVFFARYYPVIITCFLFLTTGRIRIYAQEGGGTSGEVDIDVNVDDNTVWYTSWWTWVIGIAIFIIIIVAIVSAGRK